MIDVWMYGCMDVYLLQFVTETDQRTLMKVGIIVEDSLEKNI